MHDVITIGVPLLASLAGILLNRADVKELRSQMESLRQELSLRLDRIDADLRTFMPLMASSKAV